MSTRSSLSRCSSCWFNSALPKLPPRRSRSRDTTAATTTLCVASDRKSDLHELLLTWPGVRADGKEPAMLRPNTRQWVVLWMAAAWTVLSLILVDEYVIRAVFGGWVVAALAYWQLGEPDRQKRLTAREATDQPETVIEVTNERSTVPRRSATPIPLSFARNRIRTCSEPRQLFSVLMKSASFDCAGGPSACTCRRGFTRTAAWSECNRRGRWRVRQAARRS